MNPPTAATATLAPTSNAATQVGDLVIVTTWSPTTVSGAPTHTLQAGFTEIITQAHEDGADDGRLSVAYKVATVAGASAYQAYTSNGTVGADFSGINVIKAGAYDLGNIVSVLLNRMLNGVSSVLEPS